MPALRAALQHVSPGSALALVAATTAVQGVAAALAAERVTPALPFSRSPPLVPIRPVGIGAANHRVALGAALDEVKSGPGDEVLPAEGEDLVVALKVAITSARSVPVITSSPAVPLIVGVAQLAWTFSLPWPWFWTVVDSVSWLFAALVSGGVLATTAVFEIVPVFFGWITIVTVAVAPAAMSPRLQVTVLPVRSHCDGGGRDEIHRRWQRCPSRPRRSPARRCSGPGSCRSGSPA